MLRVRIVAAAAVAVALAIGMVPVAAQVRAGGHAGTRPADRNAGKRRHLRTEWPGLHQGEGGQGRSVRRGSEGHSHRRAGERPGPGRSGGGHRGLERGADLLFGQGGRDLPRGFGGSDKLRGGERADCLYTVDASTANDEAFGDAGRDVYDVDADDLVQTAEQAGSCAGD